MGILKDPIIVIMLILLAVCTVLALRSHRQPRFWLAVMTILLFGLPRAGLVLPYPPLPLPLAHILAAIFIIDWLLRHQEPLRGHTRFGRLFLLYAAIAGFGLALGLSTGGGYTLAFMEVCFYLFAIGIFFYASETFHQPEHFMSFVKMILVVSVLVSIYGIVQRYLGSSILIPHVTYTTGGADISKIHLEQMYDIRLNRVLSSYGDPNVLMSQLMVFIGIALAIAVSRGINEKVRLLCVGVVIVNVICVIFTGSRAGIVCLIIVPMIVLTWRSRWALLLLPVIIITTLFWANSLMQSIHANPRFQLMFSNAIYSEDGRFMFPQMAWQLLQITPVGCGFGKNVFLDIQGADWNFAVQGTNAVWAGFNSFWLNLFSRLGFPGVVSFVLLFVVLLRYIWRQAKLVQNPTVKAVLVGAVAGFIGQSIIWLVNNTYMLPGGGLNFWFMMGMMVAGCRAFASQPYPMMLPTVSPWNFRSPAPV